jgi:hypothetical protein
MRSSERSGDELSRTVSAVRTGRGDAVVASALGVAVAYGALDQGGFYLDQFLNLLGLVAVALLARVLVGPRRAPAYLFGCVAAWLGFAGWAALGAAMHGELAAGLPAAAVAGCLAATVWAAVGLGGAGRRLLTAVVVAVGLVVAASGWVGVALHRPPLALPSSGVWRAASTLTYANAAAALLVTAILVALAVLPASRRRLSTLVLTVLLLGLGTTMSRAGALALAVGLATAATAPVLRRRMADSWPTLPAAAVGFGGLVPSLPETADPNPALALAGLAGAAAVLVLAERRPRCTVAAVVGGLALVALLAPAALTAIGDARLTAASPERTDLVRVALAQVGAAPLAGVGPGRLDLAYLDHRGAPVLARFVHQEYLQLTAETGLVGLGLVLAGAAALTAGAVRRRGRPAADLPTAALAVLAAFAVHSAFDFLWHIPVLPLLVVLAAVALVPAHQHTLEQEIP